MIRILLADDDEDDRLFFKEALSKANIDAELTMVENGNELIGILLEINTLPPPHMIFVDINMPLKNGKDCVKEIRRERKFDGIPVIIISTSSHPRDIDETFEYGATKYVNKTTFYMDDVRSINNILATDWKAALKAPSRENFLF
jgi:CheY-like chemotaxis protein